jgi:cytochrome P450
MCTMWLRVKINQKVERLTNDFDPQAIETFTSAHETYKDMRGKCPVAHSTDWNGFWALFKYEDVAKVLKETDTYITSVQNIVPKIAFTGRRPPLHLDPPEHTPYRKAINRFFTDKKIHALEQPVRDIVSELLKPNLEKGVCDFCKDFTHKLPGYVFSEFFNLSPELGLKIREASAVFGMAVQKMDNEAMKSSSLHLYEIARDIIASRKETPLSINEDLTAALLKTKHEGKLLPEEMILGTIRQMIVVGMIAPSVFIGCIMIHLSENKDIQHLLRSNKALIPAAVEEYLRLFTPYKGFARTANKDVEIGGRLIKKDEPIALVYASANRDEAVFPEGDTFILNRPNIHQHLAFGAGPHYCAGAPLARLMLRLVLEEVLSKTTDIEQFGEIQMTRWPEWGTLSVHLKFEI